MSDIGNWKVTLTLLCNSKINEIPHPYCVDRRGRNAFDVLSEFSSAINKLNGEKYEKAKKNLSTIKQSFFEYEMRRVMSKDFEPGFKQTIEQRAHLFEHKFVKALEKHKVTREQNGAHKV